MTVTEPDLWNGYTTGSPYSYGYEEGYADGMKAIEERLENAMGHILAHYHGGEPAEATIRAVSEALGWYPE